MRTKSQIFKIIFSLCLAQISISGIIGQDYSHKKDIVYGYKDGMALVMDVLSPSTTDNGAGIINIVSGGMTSHPNRSHYTDSDTIVKSLLDEGYVVFSIAHSSQPKYNADEIRWDIHRSIRFIRYNAELFGIDPEKIGITGRSSGGHLALMGGLAPPSPDIASNDPVDRESSKVQAVIAFFPSTDLINFGKKNTSILEHFNAQDFHIDAAFDFHLWDKESNRFERITDPDILLNYYRINSPINHVDSDDPPVLLFHGDIDKLVPIQQSEILIKKLHNEGVINKLIVREGKGHGVRKFVDNEMGEIIDWFNLHLLGIGKNKIP